MLRVNVGCGAAPTPGWLNFDNSPSVWLGVLGPATALLPAAQREFARIARQKSIRWANATRLPLKNDEADALYSSHMLEHLSRDAARAFLLEALRVLRPGGVLRLVVPDLAATARAYVERGDADAFMDQTLLAAEHPRSIIGRVKLLAFGARNHAWMYDERSLVRLVTATGFSNAHAAPWGTTAMADPGALDLFERATESVCVEAEKPT